MKAINIKEDKKDLPELSGEELDNFLSNYAPVTIAWRLKLKPQSFEKLIPTDLMIFAYNTIE